MTLSDFVKSRQEESDDVEGALINRQAANARARKRKNCLSNCWRMSTHRRIIPQQKLYDYLAEKSSIIAESQIFGDGQ